MVKEFLSQKGIAYQELDVSLDPAAARELVSRTGQMGVPVTIIGGQTIVGFDRPRLEQALLQEQPGPRTSFGAAIADASKITARQGAGVLLGAYVGRVKPGSPAARLGLSPGDIVIEVNRQRVATADDLARSLGRLPQGGQLSVVFLRGSRTLSAQGVF